MKGLVWGIIFFFDHFVVIASAADAVVDIDCSGTIERNGSCWRGAGEVGGFVKREVGGVRGIGGPWNVHSFFCAV